MTRAGVVGLFGLLVAAGPATAAGCLPPDPGAAMKSAKPTTAAAALRLRPSPVKVGEPFVVEIRVCTLDGSRIERIAIDATMPAHRHGMNYKPELVDFGNGRHEARGLLFHMPGKWQIALSVYAGGPPTHLTLDLDIK